MDFRWLMAPLRHHDPKGYITVYHQKLGLETCYQHDPQPDYSLLEDANSFEQMASHNIPTTMMANLG